MSRDRRIAERINVALDAICRREGESWQARISNVSLGGCGIELPWKVLERGDQLVLELDDDLYLPATVAWVGTKRAGLAFAGESYGRMIVEYARQVEANA
jgi:hypothetical protein